MFDIISCVFSRVKKFGKLSKWKGKKKKTLRLFFQLNGHQSSSGLFDKYVNN